MWFYASYSQQFQYIAYIVTWKYLGLGWYTRKKANGVTYDLKIRNMLNLDVLLVSVKDDPDDAVQTPMIRRRRGRLYRAGWGRQRWISDCEQALKNRAESQL